MGAPAPARSHDHPHRVVLVQELHRRYSRGGASLRFRFWVKKYAWTLAVGGAKALKRALDILVSLAMLILLSPLLVFVAACVKLTDGGPVLFWQARVGQWGREFPFPKFRSMVIDAEKLKDALLAQNQHGDGVTF